MAVSLMPLVEIEHHLIILISFYGGRSLEPLGKDLNLKASFLQAWQRRSLWGGGGRRVEREWEKRRVGR